MNILWDFDGTLFDTYPSLVQAFIELSGKELDAEEVLKWLKKDSKTAFKHYGIDESRREEYQRLYNKYAEQTSKPFKDLENVLASAGLNIIVTHRERESTVSLLEKFHLKNYFTAIVSVEEDGFERKPHISSYEHVLKNYKIDVVVGDRDLDLIPARALGIHTVAFQNRNIKADDYVDSYQEFAAAVQLKEK